MERLIKFVLAILLFLCLLKMYYGYYQFVRVSAMIGFAIIAYKAFLEKRMIEMILYIGLALLFQPLIKIALGRLIWNIIDVLVGTGLIISIFSQSKSGIKS